MFPIKSSGSRSQSVQDPFFEMLLFLLISLMTLQIALRVLNWSHSWI
jgi:hypothetical protein